MKVRVFLVLAIVAALTATTPSVGAQETEPTRIVADDGDAFEKQLLDETGFTVEEWLPAWEVTRASLGFKTPSRKWLAQLTSRTQGQTTYTDFGVPLTNLEEREMKTRAKLDAAAPAIKDAAAKLGGFAGVFAELAPNGRTRLVVRTTETVRGKDKRAIRSLSDVQGRIKFDSSAKHSLVALEDAFQNISKNHMIEGSSIHGLRVDVPNNELVVAIAPSEPNARTAAPELPDSMADMVVVEQIPFDEPSACSSRKFCGEPLRGGLEVDNLAPDRGKCTSGFMVRTNAGERAVLGAAHCGENGDQMRIGNRIGPASARFTQFNQSAFVDAALISIPNNQSSNFLYRTNGDKAHVVSSVLNPASINILSQVCLHGPKVGRSCGPVSANDSGMYTFFNWEGRNQTFDFAFDYDLTLPGRWGCFNTERRNGNPTQTVINPRWTGGNSGGPLTSTGGGTGVGTHSSCRSFTRVFHMSDGTSTTAQEPALSPSRFIESTTLTHRAAYLQEALDRVGTPGSAPAGTSGSTLSPN